MKTKFTSKFIMLILSVVMIATLCVGFSVTAFAAETDYTAPAAGEAKIYGANVNLGGDIAMKYHVEIGSDIDINKLVLKVEFLGMVKELTYSATEGNYYIFELDGINPQCMGDTINAQLVYDGNELTCANASKNNYSVKQNLVNLYNSADTNEQTKRLIIDTLEYGAAAQTYRGYKTDALVTADFAPANSDTDVTVPAKDSVLDDKSANVDIVSANVRYSTINYLLFRLNGDVDFTGKVSINGSAVTGTMEDGYYVVSTGAISPEDFGKNFTVKYDNGADDYVSLTYSVNDYCYTAANGTSVEMSGLANALYNYGLSAHLYLGEHTGGEATCLHGKLCEICGTEYDTTLDSDNHVGGVYTYEDNDDGTHKKICECGITIDEAESHTFDQTGLCVCDAQAVAKVGNTMYTDFDEALTAWTDGTTLILLDNVTLTSYITVTAENVTLDLNGKSLSGSNVNGVINVDSGSLTIDDSATGGVIENTEGWGVVVTQGANEDNPGMLTIKGGWLKSEATLGIVVETWDYSKVSIGGDAIIGVEESEYYWCWLMSSEDNTEVTVTGGTFLGQTIGRYNTSGTLNISGGVFQYGIRSQGGTLNSLLAEGYAYWQDGKMLILDDSVKRINGAVEIKSACTHETGTTTYSDNGNGTHSKTYSCCGAVVSENHTLSYSATGAVITASCSANCGANGDATITATGKTYDGTAATATVTGTGVLQNETFTIAYAVKDGDSLESAPINAGTYTASFTCGDVTASVDFTIAKADPEYTIPTGLTATLGQTLADVNLPDGWTWNDSSASVGTEGENEFEATYTPADTDNYNVITTKLTVTVSKASASVTTAPAAVENLQYTGEAQALVTAGAAEGGTVWYKQGEDGEWKTEIPTASAIGTYTVYWKVVGDENHSGIAEQAITVTISAKAVSDNDVTVGNLEASYTYTGEAIQPIITITVDDKTLVEGTDYDVTITDNTNVGTATITITFKGNYSGAVTKTFEITTVEGASDFISDWMPVG